MKIIITGSSGFLGKRLVKSLLKKNHDIFEYDILNGYDILNIEQLEKLFIEYKPDSIIHLAAWSEACANLIAGAGSAPGPRFPQSFT